ncbi:MAG: proton extrusion protein PcxA [Hormoscilla sp. GM102CHS1]|nr:proton extrusion protein PcxA [Hormoscilla sp. GM102CHS1]
MTTSNFTKTIASGFRAANQWLWRTPERSLDEAYEAALKIKALEDEHFNGDKISPDLSGNSPIVANYCRRELNNNLTAAKIRLGEFKISSNLIDLFSPKNIWAEKEQGNRTVILREKSAITLEKLKLIDEVLARYRPAQKQFARNRESQTFVSVENGAAKKALIEKQSLNNQLKPPPSLEEIASAETISARGSFLPRSILGTLKRVQKELDPKTEEEVVERFRVSKFKTIISLRFILLAILIPLLTQQICHNFLVGPVVDRFKEQESFATFINEEMEEEAFMDLEKFEEKIKFEILTGQLPKLSESEIEAELQHKVEEIEVEYRDRSANAIENIFSDIFSFVAFGLVIWTSKREITVLKSFMDDLIYGLSDSAKAFIIILFTDMFVGFHSAHGWEVILEGISRHLGLPESRNFIFLFIATFPVILDTIFKYWIFRYLNRISPSAVATYKEMNE